MKKREICNQLSLVGRGMAMGAADVVPGVSGGTIALITGIYQELIDSLTSVDFKALKLLFSFQVKDFWKKVNGNFLILVFSGIVISIFSLVKPISWTLSHFPHLVWGYFFGLIAASCVLVAREISLKAPLNISFLLSGAIISYLITIISHTHTDPSMITVYLSGVIAICAMILPGISGSFVLLLLGMYEYIVTSVKEFNLQVMMVFMLGCITGLLGFTHLLSWLLARYYQVTMAMLIGFMIGSLNKVWPWKVISKMESSTFEKNVSPGQYQSLTNQDPQTILVITLLISGVTTIFLIHRLHILSIKKNEIRTCGKNRLINF